MEIALLASVTRFICRRSALAPPARSTISWASASGGIEASRATNASTTQYQVSRDLVDVNRANTCLARQARKTTTQTGAASRAHRGTGDLVRACVSERCWELTS